MNSWGKLDPVSADCTDGGLHWSENIQFSFSFFASFCSDTIKTSHIYEDNREQPDTIKFHHIPRFTANSGFRDLMSFFAVRDVQYKNEDITRAVGPR